MRSFIGASKVLARVLPSCASFMAPLDAAIAGKQSADRVEWPDCLQSSFKDTQESLHTCRQIYLQCRSDELWIVTDGTVRNLGIGATLYINRAGKARLAGFFSAKLQKRQTSWHPCEVETLAITIAVRYFSLYIIQANQNAHVLTDSKPCVPSYEKLCWGEFSLSPRVSTFLTAVSRYQVSIKHISGAANLPSDHASRNAFQCPDKSCQICSFICITKSCVVRHSEVENIINGDSNLLFLTQKTWNTVHFQDLHHFIVL